MTFESIGELMLGIALVEMKHYAKLSDFILKIGGHITQRFTNTSVDVGKNEEEALKLAIASEQRAVDEYTKIRDRVSKLSTTITRTIATQLLEKLMADEKVHLTLLKDKSKMYE
jgi:bacterioferritin (cytochrome b1)